MPNLFSLRPVVILAWVLASTSGLTRMVMAALTPSWPATAFKRLELGRALDIDLADARFERRHQLGGLLADTGIDDALGRHAGRQRAAHLAHRHDVGPRPQLAEQADHRQARVGLHGVADFGVHALDAVGEFLPRRAQRAGRVAVERRADLGCDGGERHAFGVHLAVLVGKESHQLRPRKRRRASATARTTLAGAVPPRLLRALTDASTVSTR